VTSRYLAAAAAFGLAIAAGFSPAPVRADAGADFAGVLRDYQSAQTNLRPSARDNADLDRNGDDLRTDYFALLRKITEETRVALARVDRTGLSGQDRLSYDIFDWSLADDADEFASGATELARLMPLNQFNGAQISFARRMQWRPDSQMSQPRDYDNAIRQMLGFTRWLDQAIANMREGIQKGVTQPRTVVERILGQTEIFANAEPGSGLFMEQAKHIPDSFGREDRARIAAAYREAVEGALLPAYRRLAEFLKTEYLPHARTGLGLSGIPGGREMYLHMVKSQTTTELTPDAIHELGLAELLRIEAAMDAVKTETGFSGSLDQFREVLRTDPRFKYKDEAAMMAEFNRVKDVVLDHVSQVFSRLPNGRLAFRFYEPYVAPDKPAAEFAPGGGGRPGVVYLNAFDLPSRPTYTSEALEAHEGIPGHHLQTLIAASNRTLPRFRRFSTPTAYVEGWGLYAEGLGSELGLYSDPYQKFGALSFDAWRASRLVVDTGIHWCGWTRQEAIDFLVAHSALSKTEAAEEVDRYVVLPAQALAYKIGEREILDLRERAKAALGARFDIKRFHDAILNDGGMPLAILDAKIERWIAAEKAGAS
jgi:uncharacterized protein (DUF885 family)